MRYLIIAFALLFTGSLYGQDYTFKVLINKGQNTIKVGNEWLPLKVGVSLGSADVLKVSPNGYVGLVHVTGKPLEVKEAGSHKVADLAGQVKSGTTVLNKYTDFILSVATEERTNLNATGAVSRGGVIKVLLPEPRKAVVLNNEITISWTQSSQAPGYVVLFSSMFGDELSRLEVADTTVNVDLSGAKFANEDNIVCRVFVKNNQSLDSDDFVIKRMSAADRGRLHNELEGVKALAAEKTALNQFYLATFYEENSLLIDAATAYQNAIRLAPEVSDFRTAFNQFVIRNGMKR